MPNFFAREFIQGPCRTGGITPLLMVVLLLSAFFASPQRVIATESNPVTLRWDASPTPEVVGYRVYFGAGSGVYPTMLEVGAPTMVTISGLEAGVSYYFVVSAYDNTGLESEFSNEVSITPTARATIPVFNLQPRVTGAGQIVFTGTGPAGRTYDIQASTDLNTWTLVGRRTIAADGTLDFIDAEMAGYPARFYRASETQPTVQLRIRPGDQAVLTVVGQYNHTYDLQASPNLQDWEIIGTATLGTEGAVELTDPVPAAELARFYRSHETAL